MPLKPGSSRDVVGSNIRELKAAGYPPKQRVAIALSNARKTGSAASKPKPKRGTMQ